MTSYRTKAYIYLIFVAIIWGVATPVIKFTLGGIDPLPFLTYRLAISAVFSLLFMFITRPNLKRIKENFVEVFIYSFIVTTLALGILFVGMDKTTVLDAALISTIGPLVTAIAGVVFLKEHITSREKTGIGIAFLGTIIVVLAPVLINGNGGVKLSGNFLILGSILIAALSAVMTKKLVRKQIDPLTLTNIAFIIGFLTILPIAMLKLGPGGLASTVYQLEPKYHIGVLYMALISGTLAYSLWVKGQKTIEVSEAGVFAYLTPIFAAPLGILWLGEKITITFVIGIVLITTGVIIAEYKRSLRSGNQKKRRS